MSNQEEVCQPELLPEEWGARLTQARESLGLSVEQAAQNLNLPKDYIQTLEQGSMEGLPSMVFAKGYIRAYAKLLNLSDDEMVCEFGELHGEGSCKGQIRPVSRVREQVKMNDPVMKFSSWIFVAIIVGLSIWWWQTQDGGSVSLPQLTTSESEGSATETSTESDVQAVPMENGSAQLVLPKLDDALPGSETPQPESNEAEAAQETEPQYLSSDEIKKLQQAIDQKPVKPAEVSETVSSVTPVTEVAVEASNTSSEPVQAEVLGDVRLSIDFIAECWVSIKDANGKSLFNNLRGQGQSVNVSGQAPLNILIGAADAVGRFSFNGEEMDLAPHSRKNIVRINLPLAE